MKKVLSLIFITILIFSCKENENVFNISGNVKNVNKIKTVNLIKLIGSKKDTLQTAKVNSSGNFEIEYESKLTTFFALETDKGLIHIIVSPKENLTVSIDESNYDFGYKTNSKNCELIKKVNIDIEKIIKVKETEQAGLVKKFREKYSNLMKKDAFTLANVYILYSKINGKYIFDKYEDKMLFRSIASALNTMFPNDPYVKTIYSEIKHLYLVERAVKKRNKLNQTIQSKAKVIDFPDISLPNIDGNKIRLSSLKGKYVLLDFWSSATTSAINRHPLMKTIYNKYKKMGFEIYQVSLDVDKNSWLKAINYDELPWISVCDLKGRSSEVIGLFNVDRLPKNYLISKSGKDIIGKNLSPYELRQKLKSIFKK